MKNVEDRNVVVTGATGMVGSHLVSHLLERGYSNITLFVRDQNSIDKMVPLFTQKGQAEHLKKLNIVCTELNNPAKLTTLLTECGCSLIFHCAAKVSFKASKSQQLIAENVHAAYCVGEAALASGVDRLVHVSSIATLEELLPPQEACEANILQSLVGRSAYSVSKFYSENEMWRVSEKGLNLVVINPAVILGGGNWKAGSPKIFDIVAKGLPFCSNGITGYVSATDVARAMVLLSEKDEAIGQRYVLASANISYKELFSKIALALGVKPPSVCLSAGFLRFMQYILQFAEACGLDKEVSSSILATMATKHLYNGSHIEQQFGFKYTPLNNTIADIAAWYRNTKK